MTRTHPRRTAVAMLSLSVLVGCSAEPSNQASAPPSAEVSPVPIHSEAAEASASEVAEASASSAPAAVAHLAPGTYADVVTNDLVLRSEPGTSAESEMYPDRLNAPTSVYVADGPIAADGYAWYYVVAFDENGTVPALIGWAAAGGKDGEVWLDPVEHGNDAWSLLDTDDAPADLNPRSSAMGPDGQIYFFGGSDSSDEPAGHAWAYDPVAGAWRELAPMPTPRTGPMVAATPDGLFYVIGGAPGTTISSEDTSVVEVYDAETNRWTRTGNAPFTPDFFSAGEAIADTEGVIRVFTFGDVLRYDPATPEWEVESTGNTILWDVAMGADSSIHVLEYGGGVHAYDPAAGTLGDGSGVNGITRYGAALSPGPDGSMLVFGGSVSPGLGATCTGFRGGAALSLVEALNPSTGEWSTIAPMPQPLADAAAFTTADGVLVVGRSVRTPADPAAPQGELVVVELSLGSLTESSELAATNQDPSPSGCGS